MGKKEVSSETQSCRISLKRVLICGFGSIGRKHARILHHNFPAIELSVWRSGHGPECQELSLMTHQFTDLDVAIAWRPDAAVICSPAPYHQQQALSLTRKNIPVLIEKPLGIGSEPRIGWDELLKHSQTVPVVIGYVLRHDPCAKYVKTLLDQQKLGKIIDADFYCGSWLPDWRPGSDYRSCVSSQSSMGGGALLELSHEIDMALWLLSDFELTYASLGRSSLLDVDVEDQVLLAGRASTSSLVTIRLNMCSRPSRRSVLLRCEKGEINWDLLQRKVDLTTEDHGLQSFRPSFQPDDRFRLQAESFFRCIVNGAPPYCSLNDGLLVLRVIKEAHTKASHE